MLHYNISQCVCCGLCAVCHALTHCGHSYGSSYPAASAEDLSVLLSCPCTCAHISHLPLIRHFIPITRQWPRPSVLCVLQSIYCILCPVSCILNPESCILQTRAGHSFLLGRAPLDRESFCHYAWGKNTCNVVLASLPGHLQSMFLYPPGSAANRWRFAGFD